MPLFFIDTCDGSNIISDKHGEVYKDVNDARRATIIALPGFADGSLPDGTHHAYKAILRDDKGKTLYVATLSYLGEWQKD